MITFPAAYQTENNKINKTPSTIVEIVESGIEDSTSPNDLMDVNGSPTASLTSGVGHANQLALMENSSGDWYARQSFQMPAFRSANITNVTVWVGSHFSPGSRGTLYAQIFSDEALTVALTSVHSVSLTGAHNATEKDISFSGETFKFVESVTYYIKIHAVLDPLLLGSFLIYVYGASAGGYADGELYSENTDSIVGDADFTVDFGTLHDNYTTPTVNIYDLDIGETPTETGEWVIKDRHYTGTAITYTAVSDDNPSFSSSTSLGTIVDGDAITTLERYYRVTATMTTTVPHSSSTILQIKASFENLIKISDSAYWGHAPDYIGSNSVTKTIDDFRPSTIGQVTFKTAYSTLIRDFIDDFYPKGNTVRIKKGFISSTYTESDFVDHYLGRIEDYKINSDDTVTFTLKDFQRDLSTKIPVIGTDGATTDIEYTAQHPVTVMLDIIQNKVGIRTSKVDTASFDAVVTALSGWTVTRDDTQGTTLVEPEEAQKLLEELRLLTSTYFIPQNDGKIVLKQWDSTEAAVRTFLESDILSLDYSGNMPALFNFVLIYYDWDGDGSDPSDFGAGSGSVDATSLTNWGLTEIKQVKDKWTLAAQSAQVVTTRDKLQNRYKDPPPLINCAVDGRHSDLEVGDIVNITHSRFPNGGTALDLQIVSVNPTTGNTINLKLLGMGV